MSYVSHFLSRNISIPYNIVIVKEIQQINANVPEDLNVLELSRATGTQVTNYFFERNKN